MISRLILPLVSLGLIWGTHLSHLNLVEQRPLKKEAVELGYFPPPEVFQAISFGHDSLMADLVWLQTIQYYGETSKQKKKSPYLYRFFDVATSLDPDFIQAYIFASFILSEEGHTAKKEAKALFEKGMALNPNEWNLPYQWGIMNYLNYKDYDAAAQSFLQASQIKGSPAQVKRLAAELLKKADPIKNCQIAKNLWAQAQQQSMDPVHKHRAEKHYLETDARCSLLRMRKALGEHKEAIKTLRKDIQKENELLKKQAKKDEKPKLKALPALSPPSTLNELVTMGLLKQIPQDPWKRPYVYNSKTSTIKIKSLPWDKPLDLEAKDIELITIE